jgi:hypothetical protein
MFSIVNFFHYLNHYNMIVPSEPKKDMGQMINYVPTLEMVFACSELTDVIDVEGEVIDFELSERLANYYFHNGDRLPVLSDEAFSFPLIKGTLVAKNDIAQLRAGHKNDIRSAITATLSHIARYSTFYSMTDVIIKANSVWTTSAEVIPPSFDAVSDDACHWARRLLKILFRVAVDFLWNDDKIWKLLRSVRSLVILLRKNATGMKK